MYSLLRALIIRNKKELFYLSLCCIIKDEAAYVEEWMRYHLSIGVEHFYVYDNGSQVPIKQTLKELNLLQYATVFEITGTRRQNKAYRHCIRAFKYTSRWIGFIDIDEFIVAKSTRGDLPLFLKDYEAYGGLGINWLIFGSGGRIEKSDKPQLESFLLRSEESFSPNLHIKSIVQPKRVRRLGSVHNFFCKKPYYCVNENYQLIDSPFSDPVSVSKIQLNHYYCRSLQEYNNKIKRGFADATRQRTLKEFYYHDDESNKVKDTVILEVLEYRNKLTGSSSPAKFQH